MEILQACAILVTVFYGINTSIKCIEFILSAQLFNRFEEIVKSIMKTL